MSVFFLILSVMSAVWLLVAFGVADKHPDPSNTSLIPQVLAAAVSCLACLVISLISWLFGA